MTHRLSLLIFCFLTLCTVAASAQNKTLTTSSQHLDHPRILLFQGEEAAIQEKVAGSATWKKMHEAILDECETIIEQPPVERIKIGRRLLSKSRECLRRVFYLSYAWRMTREEKYFLRAEEEMLAVSGFSDWNPSHFLDVAEMTMAVAIGYDWLYDAAIDRNSDSPDFPFASQTSAVYDGQLSEAKRGVGIKDEQYVVIRDELVTLDKPTTIRWTMLTPADVTITEENAATLSKDGKKFFLQFRLL